MYFFLSSYKYLIASTQVKRIKLDILPLLFEIYRVPLWVPFFYCYLLYKDKFIKIGAPYQPMISRSLRHGAPGALYGALMGGCPGGIGYRVPLSVPGARCPVPDIRINTYNLFSGGSPVNPDYPLKSVLVYYPSE